MKKRSELNEIVSGEMAKWTFLSMFLLVPTFGINSGSVTENDVKISNSHSSACTFDFKTKLFSNKQIPVAYLDFSDDPSFIEYTIKPFEQGIKDIAWLCEHKIDEGSWIYIPKTNEWFEVGKTRIQKRVIDTLNNKTNFVTSVSPNYNVISDIFAKNSSYDNFYIIHNHPEFSLLKDDNLDTTIFQVLPTETSNNYKKFRTFFSKAKSNTPSMSDYKFFTDVEYMYLNATNDSNYTYIISSKEEFLTVYRFTEKGRDFLKSKESQTALNKTDFKKNPFYKGYLKRNLADDVIEIKNEYWSLYFIANTKWKESPHEYIENLFD